MNFNISCDSYKKNLFTGFTTLQQSQELVDMTLAADGHLVKVHQTIMAVASPYIKHLLQSAACRHPVIHLTGVNKTILGYILQYVYTGDVLIPNEDISAFITACQSLHIVGIESFELPIKRTPQGSTQSINTGNREADSGPGLLLPLVPHSSKLSKPQYNVQPRNGVFEIESMDVENAEISKTNNETLVTDDDNSDGEPVEVYDKVKEPNTNPIDVEIEDVDGQNESPTVLNNLNVDNTLSQQANVSSPEVIQINVLSPESNAKIHPESIKDISSNEDLSLKVTVSNRGALQVIVNKYIYGEHHRSKGGQFRRFRCVDYRNAHCPAFLDMEHGNIIKRVFLHNHASHEKKIERKLKRNKIYSSIAEVDQTRTVNK